MTYDNLLCAYQKGEVFKDIMDMDGDLDRQLTAKASKRGYDYASAVDLTEEVKTFVSAHTLDPESVESLPLNEREALQRNREALDELIHQAQFLPEEERVSLYRQLRFGLEVGKSERMLSRLKLHGSDFLKEVFCSDDEENDPAELERLLRADVEDLAFSPRMIQQMKKRLTEKEDPLITAAELSREAFERNCLCTMQLYLDSAGLFSVADIAESVCSRSAEMAAVAKAVQMGRITAMAGVGLLFAGGAYTIINLGKLMAASATVSQFAGLALIMACVCFLYMFLIKRVPDELGMAAIQIAEWVEQGGQWAGRQWQELKNRAQQLCRSTEELTDEDITNISVDDVDTLWA